MPCAGTAAAAAAATCSLCLRCWPRGRCKHLSNLQHTHAPGACAVHRHPRLRTFLLCCALFLLGEPPGWGHVSTQTGPRPRSTSALASAADVPTATTAAGALAGGSSITATSGSGAAPSSTRLVIVNDIPGHFEVLAGVLSVVQQMGLTQPPKVVFTGNVRAVGLHSWIGRDVASSWQQFSPTWPASSKKQRPGVLGGIAGGGSGTSAAGNGTSAAGGSRGAVMADGGGDGAAGDLDGGAASQADMVLCISAEMAPKVCQRVVKVARPGVVVVVLHRADMHTGNSPFLRLHKALKLVALAPHVAAASRKRTHRHADWAVPTAPFVPEEPCASKACLQGFCLQGTVRRIRTRRGGGFTRNYTALWQRLVQANAQEAAAGRQPLQLLVLGKGYKRDLGLPAELARQVTFRAKLPYKEFWGVMERSIALVPAFGIPAYYETRISSTVLASLITCVPMVAERRLLDVYTFLGEAHVFLRRPGEDEVAAMARIATMQEADVLAPRRALCALRQQLNEDAVRLLSSYAREAVASAPDARSP